jgi:hypothetical protein
MPEIERPADSLSTAPIPGLGGSLLCDSPPVSTARCNVIMCIAMGNHIKHLSISLVWLLMSESLFGFTYGEHRQIGDRAYTQFVGELSKLPRASVFLSQMDVLEDGVGDDTFSWLSAEGGNQVSYGVLNGLSGDHESDPFELEAQLNQKGSMAQQIITMHNEYIARGYTAAPDTTLARLDFHYVLLAASNKSHFYEYGKSFQAQLQHFDKSLVEECGNPELEKSAFHELGKTNSINMYVSIHILAMEFADRGGRIARTDEGEAKRLVHHAILLNAFADHFLEDSFSAGHLAINRTIHASATNNQALHNFYSANGLTVLNRRGDVWKAYGDGQFNRGREGAAPYDKDALRVIEGVHRSLQDIWNAFDRAYTDSASVPFVATISDDPAHQAILLIEAFPSLELVPIPYNSHLDTLFAPDTVTDTMKSANEKLTDRDYIRSRIGNSFVLGVNTEDKVVDYDLRINAGHIASRYTYNAEHEKKGVVDYWHGYTVSYTARQVDNGSSGGVRPYRLKGGIRSNLDYWVSDTRFLGLYSYAEAGVQTVNRKPEMVFVPTVGVQLGSLFKVHYYNMPGWLRIPAEYLLPLKLNAGAAISQNQPVRFSKGFDVDFVF